MTKPTTPSSSTWPMPRRDVRLTGHAEVPGTISQPAVLWRHHLGRGRVGSIICRDLDGDGELEILREAAGRLVATTLAGESKWEAEAGGPVVTIADLDEDGRLEIVLGGPVILSGIDGSVLWRTPTSAAPNWRTHVGKLDPAVPGLQIATLTEREEYNSAHYFTFEAGAANGRLVWENEFNKGGVYAHATSTVGDVDGDGVCEIIAAVQGGLVVLDLNSGADLCRFDWEAGGSSQRNYGQCTVADIDGDGLNEIVVMDDLIALQVVVIKVENGAGRMLWSKYWGWWYPFTPHLLHFVPRSVADMDGDGAVEVGLSVYDEDWRLQIYDGATGELKSERRNSYLESVGDIDGDGAIELLVSEQASLTPREYTNLSLLACEAGEWTVHWQHPRCRLAADHRVEFDLGTGSRSHDPKTPLAIALDGGTRRSFFVAVDEDGDAAPDGLLAIGQRADGRWDQQARWSLDPKLELHMLAAQVRPAGGAILLAGDGRGRIHALAANDQHGTDDPASSIATAWEAGGGFSAAPIVADLDGDGRNEVVVPMADGWIGAFALTGNYAEPLRRLWRYRGWGTSWSNGGGESVVVADLDRDGSAAVLVGTQTGSGNAALAALNGNGSLRWIWEVPGMAAATDFRSIHRWTVGDFTGDGRLDVYVCTRWTPHGGAGSSNESWALSGRDGNVLWHRDGKEVDNLHHCLGPTGLPSIADVNGDGVDDILMMSLDSCVVLDGRDGTFLQHPVSPVRLFGGGMWTAYGSLVVADLDGDGRDEQLTCANFGIWGAMTMERKPLWMFDPGPYAMAQAHPAPADADGDGALELGVPHPNELRCYAAATGEERWRLDLPISGDLASADIDGDGIREFIAGGSALYAIKGDREAGRVAWSLEFDHPTSSPVVADLDGDGQSEILVVTADGYLCAIGDAGQMDCAGTRRH